MNCLLLHESLVENFTLIIALIACGFLVKKAQIFPANTAEVLNLFVIYVSLPALVLVNVPKLVFTAGLMATIITPWVMLLVSVALVLIAVRLFKWSRQVKGALLLIVPLGNTSFLGIPMVEAFYGQDAIPYALMYDQFGSFFALAIYGAIVLSLFSSQQAVTVQSITKKIITFPPFISLVFALLLFKVDLPIYYFSVLNPIAQTLVPLVMFAVGFQLSLKISSHDIKPFTIGLLIKMIIAPLIAASAFLVLGLKETIYDVTVFEAAMPPMISAGALAISAKLSPKLTAAMLAYGIVLSFITLPIWAYILSI
jgi:predicted permease